QHKPGANPRPVLPAAISIAFVVFRDLPSRSDPDKQSFYSCSPDDTSVVDRCQLCWVQTIGRGKKLRDTAGLCFYAWSLFSPDPHHSPNAFVLPRPCFCRFCSYRAFQPATTPARVSPIHGYGILHAEAHPDEVNSSIAALRPDNQLGAPQWPVS